MTFLNVSAVCLMSSLPDSQDHALEGAPEAVAWQSRGTLASRKHFATREMFLDNDRWGCVISDRALPHADQHGGQIDIP